MFCTKVRTQLKALLQDFDNYVNDHIETALAVTTGIKNILTSPVSDILEFVMPASVEAALKAKLIAALDVAIDALSVIDKCKQCTDVNEKLQCFVTQLKQLDPNLQDAILHKLGSMLTRHLDGDRLKQSFYDLFTQAKYTANK